MDRLRTPFFVIAVAAIGLAVLIELAAPLVLGGHDAGAILSQHGAELGASLPPGDPVPEPSGRGVPYLALVDAVALFTVLLMGAGLVLPGRLQARVQGAATLVASIVLIIVALTLVAVAVVEVILMVTLFVAIPFGTIAYLIKWGSFPRGDAAVLLSLLMVLKLVFAAMLVAAQQRFAQNKGLVAIVATCLVANVVVAFLHGLVPIIWVSITDDVAAIVVAIVAIVWAVILLVGSIPGIVKAVKARPV